jgi:hypothetical protein
MGYSNTTDGNGQFRIHGLAPGRYVVAVMPNEQSDFFGQSAVFTIGSSNTSGIQITAHHTGGMSGVVVIDGADDSQNEALMSQIKVFVSSGGQGPSGVGNACVLTPAADGGFHLTGLLTGLVTFDLDYLNLRGGFAISRIERNGIPQTGGLTITGTEQITDVGVILSHGTGVLRGQVLVQGGALPGGSMLSVSARGASPDSEIMGRSALVDTRGQFEITGLLDTEYLVSAVCYTDTKSMYSGEQVVRVANGQGPDITVVLDLARKQ